MATTTNYSWTTPDDTDLVKDGASAIRTLGSAIDTTVFNNAGAAVAKSTVDAKGDLLVGTANDTVGRLAVGTDGYTLVADSSVSPTGLKWAAPAAGGLTLLDTMTLSGSSTTSATFSSAYKYLQFYFKGIYGSAAANSIKIRFNADTGSNYAWQFVVAGGSEAGTAQTAIRLGTINSHSATLERLNGTGRLWTPSDTDFVYFEADCVVRSGSNPEWSNVSAIYDNSAAITSFTIAPDSGTFTAGTVLIYGGN